MCDVMCDQRNPKNPPTTSGQLSSGVNVSILIETRSKGLGKQLCCVIFNRKRQQKVSSFTEHSLKLQRLHHRLYQTDHSMIHHGKECLIDIWLHLPLCKRKKKNHLKLFPNKKKCKTKNQREVKLNR